MSIIDSSNFFTARKSRSQYQIERSLRFNTADSTHLTRTPASAGNRKTWTWSAWVKRSALSTVQALFGTTDNNAPSGNVAAFRFSAANAFEFFDYTSAYRLYLVTTQVFRDTSGWYHIVLAFDTTQATASNRIKLYINGSQVTVFSTATYPTQNLDSYINNNIATYLGSYNNAGTGINFPFSGYLTEVNFIDGQALDPSYFGETDTITDVWKPKKYAGTYGTNGFFLNFKDNSDITASTLGKDYSGNGNNWTPSAAFSVTAGSGNDSMIDTPTLYADGGNGRGNYATLNVLAKAFTTGGSGTTSNGNLQIAYTATNWYGHKSTIAVTSGKWYYEVENTTGTFQVMCGFSLTTVFAENNSGVYRYRSTGEKINTTYSSYGATWSTAGDICGVAFDLDAGTITFYKNGVSQGTAFSSIPAGEYAAEVIVESGTTANVNFGQRSFSYTPPSGFKALNTQNLPEPTIKKGSTYMDVVTYTGTGSALTPTSSLGFSPDLVWIKGRSGATDHALYDAVRGVQLDLVSNSTAAETTQAQGLTAFNSNGFTVGTLAKLNTNTATYAAWCWDESATPGFDIVTYTGNATNRTIAHSLGVAPSFMMVKDRDSGSNGGAVYHASLGNTKYLKLFQTTTGTDGEATDSTVWNNTSPTSSVFSVGTSSRTNANTDKYVAYLWSEVAGFSKFGSYTGNGNADGPFVFCGFRPRWVMVKMSSSTGNWTILDSKREGYNVDNDPLFPNLANAEGTTDLIDITSNGFKVRTTDATFNTSSGTYIFAAYAESPFKYSLAR